MDADTAPSSSPGRWRRPLALALVILACLLAFLAIFAVWFNRQALDTDNWTKTSSDLLADPAINTQVAGFLVERLYTNVDVAGEIRAALPDRLDPLAGPVAGGLREVADRAALDLLSRPDAQQAWADANRRAHEALLNVLDGGGPIVSTTEGVVVLDLEALLRQLADRLGFGDRLAGALPAGAAQITVMRSQQLGLAQDIAQTLRALPILLVGLSLALFGIALAIAPRRRRNTIRAYGIGFVAAGTLALIAISLAGDAVVGSLATTDAAEPAAENVWSIATTLLHEVAVATIGYGLVMVFGAWLAGPTGWATAVRRALAPYLREPALAYGGLAAILVLLLAWAPTQAMRNPVTAALLAALLALGFEGLRRRTAKEFPDATRDAGVPAPAGTPDRQPAVPGTGP